MKLLIVCLFALAYTVPLVFGRGRIFRGKDATKEKFPYRVRILAEGKREDLISCGASLIARDWLLTAAHCVYRRKNALILLGATERSKDWISRKAFSKNNDFIIHERYNDYTSENDIALIRIPAVTLTKYIKIVKLPVNSTRKSNYVSRNVTVSGLGDRGDPGIALGIKFTTLKVISNNDCRIRHNKNIQNGMLCAKGEDNSNACILDAGSPVILTNSATQVGIVSWDSIDDCEKGQPAVFVRITKYLQWIADKSGVSYPPKPKI